MTYLRARPSNSEDSLTVRYTARICRIALFLIQASSYATLLYPLCKDSDVQDIPYRCPESFSIAYPVQ
jgi:hypothetical protein